MQHQEDAVSAIISGDFKEAVECWQKSSICRSMCDEGNKDNAKCASILEGRLYYLLLQLEGKVEADSIKKFKKWIKEGMKE